MNRYAALAPLPERVNRLAELAVNMWWSFHPDARNVFRRLDYSLWRQTAHNPVQMLWRVPRKGIEAAAADPSFMDLYTRALAQLDAARTLGTAGGQLAFLTCRTN